jgi:L-ornithine N5-oxygenase
VILATGYERQTHRERAGTVGRYLGDFEVSRDYRIVTDERCKAGIYIQGFSQASHG